MSFSGPRMAFWTKFGPPWPAVLTRRALASSICLFSSARLRSTSACARAGMAGSSPATPGHTMVAAAAFGLPVSARATPRPPAARAATATPIVTGARQRRLPTRPYRLTDMLSHLTFAGGRSAVDTGWTGGGVQRSPELLEALPEVALARLKFPRMISSDDCPTDRYCRPPRAFTIGRNGAVGARRRARRPGCAAGRHGRRRADRGRLRRGRRRQVGAGHRVRRHGREPGPGALGQPAIRCSPRGRSARCTTSPARSAARCGSGWPAAARGAVFDAAARCARRSPAAAPGRWW